MELLKKIQDSENLNIEHIFHIGAQKNSESLYDFFVNVVDETEVRLFIKSTSKEEIQSAIKNKTLIDLFLKEGRWGFIAEVYYKKIIGEDKSGYIFDPESQYGSVEYSETLKDLLIKISKKADEFLIEDLKKLK